MAQSDARAGGIAPEAARAEDRSLAELTRQLSEQASTLARKEVELAKAEMAIKAKRLGVGAGAFGAVGLIALVALGALTATIILALATAVAGWLAASSSPRSTAPSRARSRWWAASAWRREHRRSPGVRSRARSRTSRQRRRA